MNGLSKFKMNTSDNVLTESRVKYLKCLATIRGSSIFDRNKYPMHKKDIQQLIAQGRLSEALQELYLILEDHQKNEALQLQSLLSSLEREENMGLIDHSDAATRRAKINYSVLELLKDIPSSAAQQHGSNGDIVVGNKIERQINIKQGNYIENQTIDSMSEHINRKRLKSILFTAANPSNEARIQTDLEHRTIREEMQKGRNRADFQFLPTQLAVRITELIRSFKDKPTIVHFAGHGAQDGILISTDQNEGLLLNDATIKRLFKSVQNSAELVLLNSCYSAYQAELISQFGIIVIGHNLPIGDAAAVSFAKGFYLGLSEGMSYEDAYNDGITAVLAENSAYADVIEVWKDGQKLQW